MRPSPPARTSFTRMATAAATLLKAAGGLGMALVMNQSFRLKAITRALLLLPFGLLNGPWISGRNVLTGEVARTGTVTEAFAWVLTAMLLGTAIGNVFGGVLVDAQRRVPGGQCGCG